MKWKHIPDSREKEIFATFFWEDCEDWKLTASKLLDMDTEKVAGIIQEADERFEHGFEFEESYEEIARRVQRWAQSLVLI